MRQKHEWKSDPQYSRYLRPETLFGSKFEAYLNQKP
ncbi:conserved phage C-terminal domain-containing protein [Cytobacillus firmus]